MSRCHFFRCSALQAVLQERCQAAHPSLPRPCGSSLWATCFVPSPGAHAHSCPFPAWGRLALRSLSLRGVACAPLNLHTVILLLRRRLPPFSSQSCSDLRNLSHELFQLCQASAELPLSVWLRDELVCPLSLERRDGVGGNSRSAGHTAVWEAKHQGFL